jgi:mannose-6-phosphate isomerase-like protein (cupin superfamily)
MLIKDLLSCKQMIAGDNSLLREVLHPKNEDIKTGFSLAYAIVKPGSSTYRHKMKSVEVYYIIEGAGKMYIDEESEIVQADQAIYIPSHAEQYIENIGNTDLKFLCIVEPAWKAEDEEMV